MVDPVIRLGGNLIGFPVSHVYFLVGGSQSYSQIGWGTIAGFAQLRRHTRACQGICPGRNTSALTVKSGSNKIIYHDISSALADATNDLSMPCHEQRTDAAAGFASWIRHCMC